MSFLRIKRFNLWLFYYIPFIQIEYCIFFTVPKKNTLVLLSALQTNYKACLHIVVCKNKYLFNKNNTQMKNVYDAVYLI